MIVSEKSAAWVFYAECGWYRGTVCLSSLFVDEGFFYAFLRRTNAAQKPNHPKERNCYDHHYEARRNARARRGAFRHIERWNVKANPIYGEGTIVIGLVGDTGAVDKDALLRDPQVENIIKVQEPFKLANRKFHPDNSQVKIE